MEILSYKDLWPGSFSRSTSQVGILIRQSERFNILRRILDRKTNTKSLIRFDTHAIVK